MSALKTLLINRIKLNGPISVSDFMSECLFHPTLGYYTTRQPFGRDGDFITAPAISQMFGELTAAWLIECWHNMGAPSPFILCEIGPGDGTWMDDIVRTLKAASPDFIAAANIVMIEQSDQLAKVQQGKFAATAARISWAKSIAELSPHPTIIIANELFDAIPTRQFCKTDNGWFERIVTVCKNDLVFSIGNTSLDTTLHPLNAAEVPTGSIFEYAPAREALTSNIASHIVQNRGAALFIDYGHKKSDIGDTLQAVQNHDFQNVFEAPGAADITSHVDFEALSIAAKSHNAQVYKIITQADFLVALGLVERAGKLGAEKDSKTQSEISASVHRLAGNDLGQMGDLFKVMCLTDKKTIAPLPFVRQTEHITSDT